VKTHHSAVSLAPAGRALTSRSSPACLPCARTPFAGSEKAVGAAYFRRTFGVLSANRHGFLPRCRPWRARVVVTPVPQHATASPLTPVSSCSIQNQKAPRVRRSSNSFLENLSGAYSHVIELHLVMAINLPEKYLVRVSLGRPSRTRKVRASVERSRSGSDGKCQVSP